MKTRIRTTTMPPNLLPDLRHAPVPDRHHDHRQVLVHHQVLGHLRVLGHLQVQGHLHLRVQGHLQVLGHLQDRHQFLGQHLSQLKALTRGALALRI